MKNDERQIGRGDAGVENFGALNLIVAGDAHAPRQVPRDHRARAGAPEVEGGSNLLFDGGVDERIGGGVEEARLAKRADDAVLRDAGGGRGL